MISYTTWFLGWPVSTMEASLVVWHFFLTFLILATPSHSLTHWTPSKLLLHYSKTSHKWLGHEIISVTSNGLLPWGFNGSTIRLIVLWEIFNPCHLELWCTHIIQYQFYCSSFEFSLIEPLCWCALSHFCSVGHLWAISWALLFCFIIYLPFGQRIIFPWI